MFTPIYFHLSIGGEKIIKRLFLLPSLWERKYKNFFTFTPVLEEVGKYISSNDWLPGSLSYWGVIIISNRKIALANEKGETCDNIDMRNARPVTAFSTNHCNNLICYYNSAL